jgi:uncharacterized protein YjbI with pentapeptide repeats
VANPEHVRRLKEGVESWNLWRNGVRSGAPDLSNAHLSDTDLRGANLSGANLEGANLNSANLSTVDRTRTNLRAANLDNATLQNANLINAALSRATLRGADLTGSDLSRADLTEAVLVGAKLGEAQIRNATLIGADLRKSDLSGSTLVGACLNEARMSNAILSDANLRDASLEEANLSDTDLCDACLVNANLKKANLTASNLSKANLYGATLIRARLDRSNLHAAQLACSNLQSTDLNGADITETRLWESQRAGWSIRGIICQRAFWDRNGQVITDYAPGEFEKLYSEQTTIELNYPGGISTFELNTLPALLQHLVSKHPDANIHIKTIEQTGGGAKITINLGDVDNSLKEKIEADALQMVRTQLKLREDEGLRLQIENTTLRQLHETTIRMMLTAGAPQITFNAPVHTAALPSGNATVQLNQTFNDNTALIQLIHKFLTCNAELTAPQCAEIEAAKAELQKPNPDKSLLTRTLDFLKTLPKEAVLKGTGKFGEKAVEADWSNLLNQLGEFIHHIH